MRIYLPTQYTPAAKWPAIFFYHGMGGSPDTSWVRRYPGGADFIVVGLPYFVPDSPARTPAEQRAAADRELAGFRAARQWLLDHASVDDGRVFMGGISKGGWTAAALGEMEAPRLAGLIILLAGRSYGALRGGPAPDVRGKPVYIGAGETDPNRMAARRAAEYYRRQGAVVTAEEYAGFGHDVPPDAPRLEAWLEVHGRYRQTAVTPAVHRQLMDALGTVHNEILKDTNTLSRYIRLESFAEDPRLRLCGADVYRGVMNELSFLRTQPAVKEEGESESLLADILYRESTIRSLADMKAALDGVESLSRSYPQTRAGALAASYLPRIEEAYRKSAAATREASVQPRSPTNAVRRLKPAFPRLDTGTTDFPVPTRKGNRITFKPADN
jgi:predicted esterase